MKKTQVGALTVAAPSSSICWMASGPVPSWAMATSTAATTICPGTTTSRPACAAMIFSARVSAVTKALRRPRPRRAVRLVAHRHRVAEARQIVLVDVHELLVEERPLELDGRLAHQGEHAVAVGLRELEAELLELAVDGARPGVLAHHDLAFEADVLGGERLVVERVLDDAVGVDAALVGEDVGADDALPGRDGARRGGGHVLAELAEAARVQAHVDLAEVLERHDDLFEGGVAGALAEAVDGGVHVGGSGLDAGQGVGRRHAEVVVGVHLDVEPALSLEERDDVEGVERVEDAERVAEAQAVGALLLGRLAEAQQELEVGARGVLGVDRHVEVLVLGEGHALADLVEHPLPRLGQLVLDVDVAGRHGDGHGVDAAVERVLDVVDDGPVPGEDGGVEPEVDDLLDRRLLVAAHGRDADLDLVHADLVEQLGDADLLVVAEHDAGRLLAVAQRGVVDAHRRFGRPGPGDDEAGEVAGHRYLPVDAGAATRPGPGDGVPWGMPAV